jgi:hypothetical protein
MRIIGHLLNPNGNAYQNTSFTYVPIALADNRLVLLVFILLLLAVPFWGASSHANQKAIAQTKCPQPCLRVMHQKPHLPTKTCATCGRPFTWRKKWEKVWHEVKYCSERCRKHKTEKQAKP